MFDLRKAVATAIAACEEPIGEWTMDAHARPVQTADFVVTDADGNPVATFAATLRLIPFSTPNPDGSITRTMPTRAQVLGLLRAQLAAEKKGAVAD